MEFWGVEVKSGEPLKVTPGDGMILHLSQACVGEVKKDKANESVCLFVQIDGKKLVLGTLFPDKIPQQQFDLVFDKDFELTHSWKGGSVYFHGYKAANPFEGEEEDVPEGESDESESEEDVPLTLANNAGAPELEAKQEKPVEAEKANASNKASTSGKQKVKIVEPSKDEKSEEDDESSDDDMSEDDDDEDDSEDEGNSDESDEETPKKVVEPTKKRAAESASKTPVSDKKAKVTPQKTDGKKASGHVDTPHPAKQAGKTPANKPNQQTPKSGGAHTCKSCNRVFGSDKALESHSKAKHGGEK